VRPAPPTPTIQQRKSPLARSRGALGHYDREVRYSLVVSIRAPDVDVDLYAEVANQIDVGVPVEI